MGKAAPGDIGGDIGGGAGIAPMPGGLSDGPATGFGSPDAAVAPPTTTDMLNTINRNLSDMEAADFRRIYGGMLPPQPPGGSTVAAQAPPPPLPVPGLNGPPVPFTPSGQASGDYVTGGAVSDPGGFAQNYSLADILQGSGQSGGYGSAGRWGNPGSQPPTTNDIVAGGQGPPRTGPPDPVTPTATDTASARPPRPYRGRADDIAPGPNHGGIGGKADPTTPWQPNWNQASLMFRAMAPRPVAGAGMFPPLPSVPGDPPRTDPPFRAGYRPGQRA